jgi:hypothetical protein
VLATIALAHAVAESDVDPAISMVQAVLPPPSLTRESTIGPVVEGVALTYLFNYLLRARRHTDVRRLLDERLAFGTRRFGLYEAEILYQSARFSRQLGDTVAAEHALRAAQEAALRTGAVSGQSFALFGLATLALENDDPERALQLFEETLRLDQLVEPRETWADRLYIGVIACRLGRTELAATQLAALDGDGRPIVRQARDHLAGCVAALNGAAQVADDSFRSAAKGAATMGNNDYLADILAEWARYTPEVSRADLFRNLSAGLRSGSLSAADAAAALGERPS